MEPRNHGHAPPFWASSSSTSSPSSSTNASTSTQPGLIRPWIAVLVLCIAVLLFFPSILSSPLKPGRVGIFSVKSGWDMLNVCLVVFAIACGVLGRIGEGSSGQQQQQQQQVRNEWTGYSDANRTAAMSRRMVMRNSSSYPDLRTETAVWQGQSNRVTDGSRQLYDDGQQLYRARSGPGVVQMYHQMGGFGEEERDGRKAVPVANNEVLHYVGGRMEESGMGRMDYGREWRGREVMTVGRRRMRSLEALPRWEQEEEDEEEERNGRWRRRSLERFPSIEENMEKETNFRKMEAELGADDDRMEFETMHEIEEEEAAKVEEEEEEEEMAERREECLPEMQEMEEKDGNFEENVAAEKTPVVVEITPPPPPPPPQEGKPAEECGKHRRSGSSGGGGAKDLASAIALFYQKKKKKGSKSSKRKDQKHEQEHEQPSSITESNPNPNPNPNPKSNSNSVTESNNGTPSTAPPPPPPPPPASSSSSSIFHQLFSNKKGASKSRRIHSLSASTVNAVSAAPPPAPPAPPPQRGSHRPTRKNEVTSTGYRRIEDTELYQERRRVRERSNLSPYAHYPLPPRSPLPPPPPPLPPPVHENVSEIREQEMPRIGSPAAVYCPSPDVNDKADLFIRRFRDGLKLEKINSIKEKGKKRKEMGGEYDDEIQT